jgi:hypothetical protein
MASAVAASSSSPRDPSTTQSSPGGQQPGGCCADTAPGTSDRHNLPSDLPAFVAGHCSLLCDTNRPRCVNAIRSASGRIQRPLVPLTARRVRWDDACRPPLSRTAAHDRIQLQQFALTGPIRGWASGYVDQHHHGE